MMKKLFITTIILFVSIGFTNAQFFTGVNTIFAYPLNNNIIDFGIGSKVEVGYSINKKILILILMQAIFGFSVLLAIK